MVAVRGNRSMVRGITIIEVIILLAIAALLITAYVIYFDESIWSWAKRVINKVTGVSVG